jgi:serine phosphatase RsbU (regulator of sigma subunit)
MDVGRVLAAADASSPVRAVEAVAMELGRLFEAEAVSFLIADLSGRALVRLAHIPRLADPAPLGIGERREADESATVLPFDGGPAEQVVRTQAAQVLAPDSDGTGPAGWRMLAPVTERGEAIGLLELFLPQEPSADDVAEICQLAHLLAFVVIANRRHTDLFEWGARSRPFSLSAEVQHRLLPEARTCEAAAFTLSGWLEPAASIGGDTFDYTLARDALHLSLTDAMGHGVAASLTATVCLASLRGSRRRGVTLLERVATANDAIAKHATDRSNEHFATGLIGRLDLRDGSLELVNAGHVAPYLARGADVTALALAVDLPLGMFPDTVYSSTLLQLEPGDRVVFVTDGMLERSLATVDLIRAIGETRDFHAREVVRHLADSALEATGHALSDDATVLCLDWHGVYEDRLTVDGADPGRASDPLA